MDVLLKCYICEDSLKYFSCMLKIQSYYLFYPLMRYKKLSLIFMILLQFYSFISRNKSQQGKQDQSRTKRQKSNIGMDILRGLKAGNSVLTLPDFSAYKASKEKKSFNSILKVLYVNFGVCS